MGLGGLAGALAGKHLLLTGGTGFVGEAFLERVLVDLPDTRLTLVVRGRPGESARDRVAALLAKPAFSRLPGHADGQLPWHRVEVVEGELGGLLPPLPADVDVLVHCAGEVSFDPPVDEGFRTNLEGTRLLLAAVRATGAHPHVVHVSTAYVAGLRQGWVAEERHPHTVDWRAESAAAEGARARAEVDSRSPEVLAELLAEARSGSAGAGTQTAAAEAERLRVRWVRRRLVEAGRQRALSLGWADCYTLTKALTERMVEETCREWNVPLSIVRPTIIESALERPSPGWIEGFKMAEPIILSYGRGDLVDFPAAPDGPIDIIPVDLVVNAMIAVAATVPLVGEPAYFQVGSSARNPLRFRELYQLVREYFLADPLPARDRGTITPPVWSFSGQAAIERRLRLGERAQAAAKKGVALLPAGDRTRAAGRRVDRLERRLRAVRRLAELYQAYTQAELIYADDRVLQLYRSLTPADQQAFPFDSAAIDWHHYLVDLHCPAVTGALRFVTLVPQPPLPAPAPIIPRAGAAGQVVAAFDMDGTLLASTVVEAYLWSRLADTPRHRWPREIASVAADLPRLLLADRTSRAGTIRSVAKGYAGADPEALAALVDAEVAQIVLAKLSAAAIRIVREHRAAGHRTVLITGALDVFTRPIAALFDEVCAARLAVDAEGVATGRLVEPPVVGEGRSAWLRRRAGLEGWDLAASHAYADSHSDVPMLRTVGHPVAVNPDLDLARIARRERWPVVSWPATAGTPRLVLAAGAG